MFDSSFDQLFTDKERENNESLNKNIKRGGR